MRWFLVIFIFSFNLSFSQEIKGIIKHHSQPVPYANVFVKETSNGTITNNKGEFSLVVNSLEDSIVISCTSFQTRILQAQFIKANPNIHLEKSSIELEVVTINEKDDRAKKIIKNVIKNRHVNDYLNTGFTSNLYVKSIVSIDSKDSNKLVFTEKFSQIEHSKEGKWKETKIGLKDLSPKEKPKGMFTQRWGSSMRRRLVNTQSKTNLFYDNISDGNFNFYNSIILIPKLAQNPFISPTGYLGTSSYDYQYDGIYLEHGKTIHKISVTPKRPEESVFEGEVHVGDSTWQIVLVNLKMNGKKLHRYNTFKVYQRYVKLNEHRILDRQEFFFNYTKSISKEIFNGTVYCKFSNYKENNNLKIGNLTRITLDSAESQSDTFWEENRAIGLSKEEQQFILLADSLKKVEQSKQYIHIQDSLKSRFTFEKLILTGVDHYNTPKGIKWKIDPLIKQARIFGIGGYRHAIGGQLVKEFQNKNELYTNGTINYGFKNKDLLADAELKYTYSPRKFAQFRLSGGSKYQMLTYMQNLSTLFSRGNFVQNDFLGAGHFFEITNGLFLDFEIKYMKRTSLEKLSLANWSEDLFGENNKPISFEDYNELNFKSTLSFTPFQKFALEGRKKIVLDSKWPIFHLSWEQGIPEVLNSKIDFQKIKLGIDHSFKIGLIGTSKIMSWYGKYLNTRNVEYPNYTFFRGTDNYFFSHPLYTFQLLGKTFNSLESYYTLNYIHHFHGAIVKKIPYIKKTKLETVAGGGIVRIDDINFNHGEIYSGAEIPFRLGETKLKLGAYYAVAYSNYSSISNMIKFGLNVFNPFTNKWAF